MICIILYRINGGKVQAVLNDDEEICEFPHMDAAVRYALNGADDPPSLFAKICESGQADYQIVELNEL